MRLRLRTIRWRALLALGGMALLAALLRTAGTLADAAEQAPLNAGEVLSRIDAAAESVKTVSAQLTYTTVTVLVNDHATQYGELYFRKGKRPELLVRFTKPEPKVILFKRSRAEIYYPKINQIQEYNLEQRRNVLQQFLLLGFGTRISQLQQSYHIKYLGEKTLGSNSAPVLELTPLEPAVARQLTKVQLWISKDSWLPLQQEFFEPSGDYLIARYTGMKINHHLGPRVFRIKTHPGVQRTKMN